MSKLSKIIFLLCTAFAVSRGIRCYSCADLGSKDVLDQINHHVKMSHAEPKFQAACFRSTPNVSIEIADCPKKFTCFTMTTEYNGKRFESRGCFSNFISISNVTYGQKSKRFYINNERIGTLDVCQNSYCNSGNVAAGRSVYLTASIGFFWIATMKNGN